MDAALEAGISIKRGTGILSYYGFPYLSLYDNRTLNRKKEVQMSSHPLLMFQAVFDLVSTLGMGCERGVIKGALIIRIGFWSPLYYNYTKEPPKIVLVIY